MIPKGILYIATGPKHLGEAIVSARSVKACMPDLHVTLFTDRADVRHDCFDDVRTIDRPRYTWFDKIEPLKLSPYERTVFLDSDTYVCGRLDELFTLLDRFDVAAAHDSWRVGHRVPGCPEAFPEFNSGVITYRNTPAMHACIDRWLAIFTEHLRELPKDPGDQAAFRQALYESALSLYVLPSEYNYMLWTPGFIGGGASVKIVHGRSKTLVKAGPWMNESNRARVFVPSASFLNGESFDVLSRRGRPLVRWWTRFLHVLGRGRPLT